MVLGKLRQKDQEFKAQPGLHGKSEALPGCVRPCLKKNKSLLAHICYVVLEMTSYWAGEAAQSIKDLLHQHGDLDQSSQP